MRIQGFLNECKKTVASFWEAAVFCLAARDEVSYKNITLRRVADEIEGIARGDGQSGPWFRDDDGAVVFINDAHLADAVSERAIGGMDDELIAFADFSKFPEYCIAMPRQDRIIGLAGQYAAGIMADALFQFVFISAMDNRQACAQFRNDQFAH